MVKIAVFDVDGTLIKDNIGITFIKYLLKENQIRTRQKLKIASVFALYKAKILSFSSAIKLGATAVAGRRPDDIELLARKCFSEKIQNKIFKQAIDEIDALREKDYRIILATGAHESIARIFAEYLKSDLLICTISKQRGGFYDDAVVEPLPFEKEKANLVRRIIDKNYPNDKGEIICYTDDMKDVFLFDIANICVAVNADPDLIEAAKKRGGRSTSFA